MTKPANYPETPKELWSIFYDFTRIPRPSGHEQKIIDYIKGLAEKHGATWKQDAKGNLVVYVPASEDRKDAAPLLVQNHVDMVCDNTPDRTINFEVDPIELKIEDEWLLGDRTTLGADNGIGCAAALALMTDPTISHPPMELLFTVEEETGLYGASALDPTLITAKRMLNLDTEDWGMIFIGCAGGFGVKLKGNMELEAAEGNIFEVEIKGLRGGHSGIDIHLQQGNAIILLATFLTENDLRVCSFDGGRAHNIIPRDARAVITTNLSEAEVSTKIQEFVSSIKSTLHKEDQKIEGLVKASSSDKQLSKKSNAELLTLILTLPHGAHKFERESKDILVSQSSNLAEVKLSQGNLDILSSVRFFDPLDTKKIKATYKNLAAYHGMQLDIGTGYPSWKPVFHGKMLELVVEKYKSLFGIDPAITAIHAGLECGIVKDKLPDLDIVSIGPSIRSAHTPRERIEIPTVENFWKLLTETVKSL